MHFTSKTNQVGGSMETKKKAKIERYLKNSPWFLWKLGPGNQQETYKWLEGKGFNFTKGSYDHVTAQLLENPGINQLLERIVVPEIHLRFTPKTIEYLRDCWNSGTSPNLSLLSQAYNVKDAFPFLEVNVQFNYVERWGEFAGLWFEEMEE